MEYDVTFATKGGSNLQNPCGYATICYAALGFSFIMDFYYA